MAKRILAIAFIYGCCSVAWFVLGGTVVQRTHQQSNTTREAVGSQWGGEIVQFAPTLERLREEEETTTREVDGGTVTETRKRTVYDPTPLAGTTVSVAFALEHRRKGLVWYPTYRAEMEGRYRLVNETDETSTGGKTTRYSSRNRKSSRFAPLPARASARLASAR